MNNTIQPPKGCVCQASNNVAKQAMSGACEARGRVKAGCRPWGSRQDKDKSTLDRVPAATYFKPASNRHFAAIGLTK